MTLFLGILAVAMVLDNYFDNNSVEISSAKEEPQQAADEYAAVYIIGQTNSVATKTSIQKSSNRKLLEQHDKFLRKYHESQYFKRYKIEVKETNTHLFIAFQHLLFRNYYISVPDDDPHLS